MGRPRLTLLCGVILAATAFATPAFAIDPADPLASETTTLAPVPVVARSGPSWVAPQIASVVSAGLMGPDVPSFRPDDPLTRGELHEAIVALGKPHRAPTDPHRIVTMRELDAQLVAAAGPAPVREADPARRPGRRARADGHARHGDRRPPSRAPRQPSRRSGRPRALAEAARLARRGGVLAREAQPPRPEPHRCCAPGRGDLLRPDVDRVAAPRAHAGAPLRRLSLRVRRNVREAADDLERERSRQSARRARAASTARGSCGGCSSCSRTTAHPPSPTSSRAGRRTR